MWAPGDNGPGRLREVDRVCCDRWAKWATDVLREADVPAWTSVKDTVDPGQTLKGLVERSPGRYCAAEYVPGSRLQGG